MEPFGTHRTPRDTPRLIFLPFTVILCIQLRLYTLDDSDKNITNKEHPEGCSFNVYPLFSSVVLLFSCFSY